MSPHSKAYSGFFLTVEGGDGSGKSTVAVALAAALKKRNYDLLHTREPGGTPLSEHIRKLLLEPPSSITISEKSELLLYLAARVEHLDEVLLPALRQGKIVLCERFNDSTIAYQGCARHLGMGYVEELCTLACSGVEPDLTLFLDIAPELGLARVKKERGADRLEREDLQFHHEVRQGYLHLADKYPQRISILDAEQPLEMVIDRALVIVEERLTVKPVR